ncbi:MAG: hypothetical protein U0X91_22400 [Spirosomataceae bacterium]
MKLIDIATYLIYTATYSIAVPIGIGLYFYASQSKALRIVLGGLVCVLFLDIVLLWFLESKYTFLYLFSIVDAVMMTWAYSVAVTHSHAGKLILTAGLITIPIIASDAFFGAGLTGNGYSNAFEKVVISVVVIYYLTQLFQDEEATDLRMEPLLWVSVGVLIFNLVALGDVFSAPMLNFSQSLYLQYYMVLCLATIFLYGCFSYAFWLSRYNDCP